VTFEDETWWSRLAQPTVYSWEEEGKPLHLVEREVERQDPEPKALCCYGLLCQDSGEMLLRFVEGQAVSVQTVEYLEWVCQQLGKRGVKQLVMIWDNASWHGSKAVRGWIKQHNQAARQAQREGKDGVKIIPCWLPVKSPWLNSIEPKWQHGKKAIVEPTRKLTQTEIIARVYDYFHAEPCSVIAKKVA
jgi:transposase